MHKWPLLLLYRCYVAVALFLLFSCSSGLLHCVIKRRKSIKRRICRHIFYSLVDSCFYAAMQLGLQYTRQQGALFDQRNQTSSIVLCLAVMERGYKRGAGGHTGTAVEGLRSSAGQADASCAPCARKNSLLAASVLTATDINRGETSDLVSSNHCCSTQLTLTTPFCFGLFFSKRFSVHLSFSLFWYPTRLHDPL
jgi:hypothetical protein